METYAQYIIFDGLTFAYSDWNLYELEGSHGNATTQNCTIYTKYSDVYWHNDLYRAFDVAPAAVHVSTAHDVDFINGGFESTGYLGIHLENDVYDCDIIGNFIAYTGGGGITVGHLQHIYENDTEEQRAVSYTHLPTYSSSTRLRHQWTRERKEKFRSRSTL